MGARPFDEAEDRTWRAIIHIATLLPRHLNDELLDTRRLSLSEFGMLFHLSEADDPSARMADLAKATGLSASHVTRAIEDMRRRGWVTKSPHATDGRSTTLTVTDAGRQEVSAAYDVQVADARRILFDHLDPNEIEQLGRILSGLAQLLQEEDRVD